MLAFEAFVLPALGGVAAVLIGTAGLLTARTTSQRGVQRAAPRVPLPSWVTRLLDAPETRLVASVGLVAVIVVGLVRAPFALWLGLAFASACLGPFWPSVNPLRMLLQRKRPADRARGTSRSASPSGWLAAGWLLLFAWLSLCGQQPGVGALLLAAGYAGLQLLLTWRRPELLARTDAVEACARVIGSVAPFGRGKEGRFELRSAAGALSRMAGDDREGRALLPVSAALVGANAVGLVHTTTGPGLSAPMSVAAQLLGATLVCHLALALAAHRAFLARALRPVAAGWALTGAVNALQRASSVTAVLAGVLLTLTHMIALSAAHRMAVARFDLRSARAVQFPFRLMVLFSALAGVALLVR